MQSVRPSGHVFKCNNQIPSSIAMEKNPPKYFFFEYFFFKNKYSIFLLAEKMIPNSYIFSCDDPQTVFSDYYYWEKYDKSKDYTNKLFKKDGYTVYWESYGQYHWGNEQCDVVYMVARIYVNQREFEDLKQYCRCQTCLLKSKTYMDVLKLKWIQFMYGCLMTRTSDQLLIQAMKEKCKKKSLLK